MSHGDDIRDAMVELLAKAMQQLEDDLVVTGYAVLCFDRTPPEEHIRSTMVFGPFDTELEAVEFAVTYHEQVNRGLAADDPEGWDTAVKPVIARD